MSDTIYALSTILGKSGVAVIRISGPLALSALKKLTNNQDFKPRQATLVTLISPSSGYLLDQALALYFKGPHSFTGEEVVEIQSHGSIAVIKDLMTELRQLTGLRLAEAGEFTRRALEQGKMNLVEVEALSELIEAETSLQRLTALYQLSGQLTTLYQGWRDNIIAITAKLEAFIDFPDEDLPAMALVEALAEIEFLANQIEEQLRISARASKLLSGASIAIVGPPNAGKSSLMNLLAREEVAIVSEIAGTTRDVIQVRMEIKGLPVTLYDTAGIREEAQDQIEEEGIRRAREILEKALIKIFVFDSNKLEEMKYFTIPERDSLVIINKIDLVKGEIYLPTNSLAFSNKEPNLELLLERIGDLLGDFSFEDNITSQQRQIEKLEEALLYLKSVDLSSPLELVAQAVRQSLLALEYLLGEISLEEILDKIFSAFCIGK